MLAVTQLNWGAQDQVVILTNQCIMKLRAPGFAQVHRAAESNASPTTLMEVPPAEVRWAIPWQVQPQTYLYSTAGPTLEPCKQLFSWQSQIAAFVCVYVVILGSCSYMSVHNDACSCCCAELLVGVAAGPVDSRAQVRQQRGALPRQADCAPQGQARPAGRRAPGP